MFGGKDKERESKRKMNVKWVRQDSGRLSNRLKEWSDNVSPNALDSGNNIICQYSCSVLLFPFLTLIDFWLSVMLLWLGWVYFHRVVGRFILCWPFSTVVRRLSFYRSVRPKTGCVIRTTHSPETEKKGRQSRSAALFFVSSEIILVYQVVNNQRTTVRNSSDRHSPVTMMMILDTTQYIFVKHQPLLWTSQSKLFFFVSYCQK